MLSPIPIDELDILLLKFPPLEPPEHEQRSNHLRDQLNPTSFFGTVCVSGSLVPRP